MNTTLISIENALESYRYETARRLCLDGLEKRTADANALRKLLHKAYLLLGDFSSLHQLLDAIIPTSEDERLEITLLHATDFFHATQADYYRESAEAKAGLTLDECNDKMNGLADCHFAQALDLAKTESQRQQLAEALIGVGRTDQAKKLGLPVPANKIAPVKKAISECGTVSGIVKFPDGTLAARIKVTLGLHVEWRPFDVAHKLDTSMDGHPFVGPQEVLTTETDADGAFRFEQVPAEKQDFIAVTLDAAQYDIPTRFLAQGIDVPANGERKLNLVVNEWTSAPPREVKSSFAEEVEIGGVQGQRVFEQLFKNPFYFNFPRQLVRIRVPPGVSTNPERLVLLSALNAEPEIIQVSGRELLFFAELPSKTDRIYALYEMEKSLPPASQEQLTLQPQPDGTAVVDTGRARFRVPLGAGADALPPLLAVQGPDAVWRGQGRFRLPANVTVLSRQTEAIEIGSLVLEWTNRYQLSNGASYEIRFTAHRGEPYLLAHEISPEIEGASFEFSLKEFHGGRGYMHWKPERGFSHSWSTLKAQDKELARLQESVAWWVPPLGMGYVMTADGLEKKDCIGVFTIRRGDWIDRKFETLTQGPKNADGTENRELDWPFCEMVGSTISMITAQTDTTGDAYFKFGLFNGERHWGIIVSDLEHNDGPFKEISAVQHKNSSPRLQDFKDWHLDEPDHIERPYVVTRRKDLRLIRERIKSPTYANFWDRLTHPSNPKSKGSSDGAAFAVSGDPAVAWRKKLELLGAAPIRSKMTLLGRDFGDMYSPVGARPITPWAEEYDLIAASGVFTPEEEREVRAFLLLMGHLYMTPDLMNWRYNSRNANFEADRVDVVAAVGFAFHGNPDGDRMVAHAAELMEKSINVYCTPGSGKWYENPACYYLHASKCRLNLAFHLASHAIQDPTRIPRMKDFLRWGVLLLTPPYPHHYDALRDGLTDAEYRAAEKARRVPPIGDHAHVGSWVPDHYATMSKWYRKTDPEFADLLLWAFQSGRSDGGYFSNPALIIAGMEESELAPAPQQTLTSRRLEGFGSVFRGHFGQPNEFYLLLKQGPGGYRYHRTEGSILLFADGKPLIYDGGEGGETWRHTTLSFYETHMPLASGHVERFSSFSGLDFSQGVHPLAIKPGDPVFANDNCHHHLVPVAWQRYAEPDPVDVRSVLWIKDEYVILHDDLHLAPSIPSFWHMQVVAGGETGNARDGYVFKGRFGTDLQVLLPDQDFIEESCVTLPLLEYHLPKEKTFAMRHLQLRADKPDHYLAVIRPLAHGRGILHSHTFRHEGRVRGVHVQGETIDDRIFLSRDPFRVDQNGVRFEGRYGAVLKRPDHLQLALLAGTLLEAEGIRIESNGPAVFLTVNADSTELAAEGNGVVTFVRGGKSNSFQVAGAVAARLAGS